MTIINDILDFSKIEAGKLEVESIHFNLPALVDDVARMMAHHAHSKGLELIIDVSDDVRPDVISDPSRIRQILTNLILNALKCSEVHQQGAHFWFDLKLKKTRGARTVTRAPAFGLQTFGD